ncbi:hypothetical protein QUA08_25080, partial [Microcoleus sp. T3B2]|uniref:hypothetical protein n=1 Tax=Microcoleus sp. T3B2 TaxID=3055426 RepID=UPI002FD48D61
MNLRTNLFERSLELSSYLAIALATRSHTIFDVGFSIKTAGVPHSNGTPLSVGRNAREAQEL